MTRMAWGAGLSTVAPDGTVLDAWFRWYGWGEYGDDDASAERCYSSLLSLVGVLDAEVKVCVAGEGGE